MFVSGRSDNAKVELVGEPDAVKKLTESAGGIQPVPFAWALCQTQDDTASRFDRNHAVTDPQQQLDILARVRADLSGKDSVLWFTGNVYAQLPGERSKRLWTFEGYNISRIVRIEDGYRVLTREAAFYKDPGSCEILDHWHNPLNDRSVDVVHVWNDPVNQKFTAHTDRGPFSVPLEDLRNGMTCLSMEVSMAYPSPLPRADYPLNSSSDLYKGAELFNYFVSNDDLENDDPDDVPCTVSWTRIAPWLPWMEMADAPGDLLYQCRGSKLSGGYAALPNRFARALSRTTPSSRWRPTSSPSRTRPRGRTSRN